MLVLLLFLVLVLALCCSCSSLLSQTLPPAVRLSLSFCLSFSACLACSTICPSVALCCTVLPFCLSFRSLSLDLLDPALCLCSRLLLKRDRSLFHLFHFLLYRPSSSQCLRRRRCPFLAFSVFPFKHTSVSCCSIFSTTLLHKPLLLQSQCLNPTLSDLLYGMEPQHN